VLAERLDALVERGLLTEARTIGLWAGIDLDPALGTGRELCEALLERGVLAKDARAETIRLSPPLSIVQPELEMALDILEESLVALRGEHSAAAANEAASGTAVGTTGEISDQTPAGTTTEEATNSLGGATDGADAGVEPPAAGENERSELSPTAG
jgi:ornithine--oxo-acid transaminase